MKKIFNSIVIVIGLVIIFFIASLFITGCDKEDVKPFDLNLFDGNWEVTVTDESDVFGRNCILEISYEPERSEWLKMGRIDTYYINGVGIKFYDKEYSWCIRQTDNGELLLSLELEGLLDSDEPWAESYFYRITKLNDTHMWWQAYSDGNSGTMKMHRRTDL